MLTRLASWALLLASVLSLGFTAHAFFPRRGPRTLIVSFAASMLTIELAAHHLLAQLCGAAILVALGALTEWPGRLALVAYGLSWIGLGVLIVEGRGARAVMRSALSGFVRDLDGPRVPRAVVIMTLPVYRAGVRRVRDVTYARVAGRRLKLDVYLPTTPPASGALRPAVLQIHGGAWVVGDKREQGIPLCMHLAAAGWVAFNANYRLSPGATFPDHLVDLKRALAFIREHAGEYGIDPSFVAVTGGSAGGHLATLMALTANDPTYQPGFEAADTSVQAAVPFYGVYDFTNRFGKFPKAFVGRLLQAHVVKARLDEEPEKFRAASPIDRVRPDAPPFLVIHGARDTLAPLEDARAFVAELRATSRAPVLFAELHGAQHAFDLLVSPRSAPVVEGVERFLNELYVRHRERPSSHFGGSA
jgi:acetyl esterase/lipase